MTILIRTSFFVKCNDIVSAVACCRTRDGRTQNLMRKTFKGQIRVHVGGVGGSKVHLRDMHSSSGRADRCEVHLELGFFLRQPSE